MSKLENRTSRPWDVEATDRPGESALPGLRRLLAELGVTAVASVVAAVVALRLWEADLRVPFDYNGDALWTTLVFKTMVDHGWALVNPHLGAPAVLQLYDFPQADNLHLLIVKAMSLFSSDWALLLNLYFLLGFPLIACTSLFVLRRLRVGFGPALVASLLYAFLPCRLLKGEQHLMLGMFFQVPLGMLVAIWVCGDAPPLERWKSRDGRRRSIAALVICVIMSMTGLYYAFFTGVLLVAGGAWASLRRRTSRNVLAAVGLSGVMVLGLAVNALPTVIYTVRNGRNPRVAARSPAEAEVFGMRIAQLLLPITGHRVPALRAVKQRYDAQDPHPGESSSTGLGTAGSLGFLALLGLMFLGPRKDRPRDDLLRPLAVLNLVAVLLGTVGGFGSLMALLVTPQIRTYSRISVVIGFLSLCALALLADRVGRGRRFAFLILPVGLLLGLLDQVAPGATRRYAEVKDSYRRDQELVREIEADAPDNAMIFQLPYQEFPEAGRQEQMAGYEPIRPYLHSHRLRWSYPTMQGRTGEAWANQEAELTPERLIETLSDAGFYGILVDRNGYGDHGARLEAGIGLRLDTKPLVGADGRLAFFSLAPYNRRALANLPPAERERRRDLALHPVLFQWASGFYNTERSGRGTFRWCSGSCEIAVESGSSRERRASIAMTVSAARPTAHLTIEGDLLSRNVALPPGGTRIVETLAVSPGRHLIRLRSDSAPAYAPGDPRHLIMRVDDVSIEQLTGPQ